MSTGIEELVEILEEEYSGTPMTIRSIVEVGYAVIRKALRDHEERNEHANTSRE